MTMNSGNDAASGGLRIGWAQADITPESPVLVCGQFHARVSEGVADPITATALVLDSGDDHVVFVSCDLVCASEELRGAVRAQLAEQAPGLDPGKVVLHATHTHTAPEVRPRGAAAGYTTQDLGVELAVMPTMVYVDFAAGRIAEAVARAWRGRAPGGVAFGMNWAVVGRNRRWVDIDGASTMYGNTNTPRFSHIEGAEDHSVNVLATYDAEGALTGVVVNVPSPSQTIESLFVLSADYWHDTRVELRRRLGDSLFVLAQCSAAGDQSPHPIYEKRAVTRMLELQGRSEREEIARRLANAVEDTLAAIGGTIDRAPRLRHHVEMLDLPLNALTAEDIREALKEADVLERTYMEEMRKLEADPSLREQPRWYVAATRAHRRMLWFRGVAERFERQKTQPTLATEVHVVRLGDVALATNRFEYYLDFGMAIKARSPAVQTFLVQLAGPGTYVPSSRSVAGGGYGSIPASNPVGPEGGRRLAERTVEIITDLWSETG